MVSHSPQPASTEDFNGGLLAACCGSPTPILSFLLLAVSIADALSDVHRRGILHKNIKPENILVNDETGAVKIIDFRIASRIPREQPTARGANVMEGSLPYMSPEQTGRMNRWVDLRADLYSLGVTLYELLTGRLPFQATNPLEWVHCHIARAPPRPTELVPSIPEPVADIVLKLLAKAAEDRYESAHSLKLDLERCLSEWRSGGRITPFALGQRGISGRLHLPQKLYGRDGEIAELQRAFEQVLSRGKAELVVVSGYSGIGKSSLVNELHKPVVRAHGFFVSGKFDLYQRNIPYSTLVQAFRELMRQILSESEERIRHFRARLTAALGANGQLIIDVIPDVALLIGNQPPVPPLPPTEAQTRFTMVFQRFIEVFTQKEHPLALFLDDLQWADAASLKLIEHVLTHPDTRHLLLVGAYRDNEVSASHPLMLTLSAMREASAVIDSIVLAPLSPEHLSELIADMLRCRRQDAEPLARLVHDKTFGNPFFAIQFLITLHQERLIEFDAVESAWRWDVGRIRAQGYTDNIVDFMVGKLRRLPTATQGALKLAACLESTAAARTLALLCGRTEGELRSDLGPAVEEGLLLHQEDAYRFLHDRVQQAAYSLIPENERAAVHLRIGRILFDHTPESTLGERVFDIVNQLNLGASLIDDRGERRALAALNLTAGKRAKASAAYVSASAYFYAGMALLDQSGWEEQYELAYGLHFQCAECEYMNARFDASEAQVREIVRHARTNVDKASAHQITISLHMLKSEIGKAVEAGVEALRLVGVDLPAEPTRREVEEEYEKLWEGLGDRPIAALADLPGTTDPAMRTAMDVLAALVTPTLYMGENVFHMVPCRMVNIALRHGSTESSPVGYVFLGMVLSCARFDRYQEGYRFGKLAYDLVAAHGGLGVRGKVAMVFGKVVHQWTHHIKTSIDYLDTGYRASMDSGDLAFACYCCNQLLNALLTKGDPLDDVYAESERRLEFVRKSRYEDGMAFLVSMQLFIQSMRGLTPSLSTFGGADVDAQEFEEQMSESRILLAVCWHHILKLQLLYLAGDYEEAVATGLKAKELLWTSTYDMQAAEYYYYFALAVAAAYDKAPPEQQAAHRATLAAHEHRYRIWADNGPENFATKHLLLCAEIARIERRDLDAMRLYDRAIQAARESAFPHNEGIANEAAARFYMDRGFATIAPTYLREAHACYRRWGADGKVRQLEQRYAGLFCRALAEPDAVLAVKTEQLDLLSVVRASQSISGEILLPRLLATLMQTLLEQAGAQRGCLLRARGETLEAEVEAIVSGGAIEVAQVGQARALSGLPESLLNYVRRTRESLVLDDAAADARFSGDSYIVRTGTKSALCLPLLRRSELIGLLYLENNLLVGAFSRKHLSMLELLASQAAISLENAALYADLEQENHERIRVEAELKEKLEIIEEQREAIRVLSTPIIEVWDGVLMAPVLGLLDPGRAAQMMQSLLGAVVRARCRHVIIDLTAVAYMDDTAADQVLKIVDALRLLGAHGIVVGLQPRVAQAVVSIGVDLARLTTVANVHAALVLCMKPGFRGAQLALRRV